MSDLRVKTFLFPVFSIDIPTGTASITPQITNVDAAAPETLSVYPYKGGMNHNYTALVMIIILTSYQNMFDFLFILPESTLVVQVLLQS